MIPLDRPHAWDAHGRAFEAINSLLKKILPVPGLASAVLPSCYIHQRIPASRFTTREHHHEASPVRSPPNQRGTGFPFHSPHAWGMHRRAWDAINSLWGSPKCTRIHGAAQVVTRNDSTAATDNAPNEVIPVCPPPTQRDSGVPSHAPHVWGTHGRAWDAMDSL